MMCPLGTKFSLSVCNCITGSLPTQSPVTGRNCSAETVVYLPLDTDYKDVCEGAPATHRSTYLQTGFKNNGAHFQNWKSKLEIPRLSNWFSGRSRFTVAFWFKRTWSSSTIQGLANNGDCNLSPSFDIYLEKQTGGPTNCVAELNGQTVASVKVSD